MVTAYFVCASITLVSAAASCGFSLAALRGGHSEAQTNAMHVASRSLALLIICLIPMAYESVEWLTAAALAMILSQTTDAFIGLKIRDNLRTYWPAIAAVANLLALVTVTKP